MSSVRSSASSMPLAAPSFLILSAAALVGRKSPTAAAMTRTSHASKRLRAASASSEAVSTSTYSIPAWRGSPTLAATQVTAAPRRAASSATAKPMRPEERLPTKRTASIGSRVPPAVIKTRTPARSASPAKVASTAASSSGGSGRRPAPHSPREPSAPVPGSSTSTPRARRVSTLAWVAGCSHM